MIRRPPRSTQSRSSAASDVYKRQEIPVNREVSLRMNLIDELIADPNFYYDDSAIDGFVKYCEAELTLTDGSDFYLLESFKLWAEDLLAWFYLIERSVYVPSKDGHGGHYERKTICKRLINKQYLIVARGSAKSMYAECIQSYFLVCLLYTS